MLGVLTNEFGSVPCKSHSKAFLDTSDVHDLGEARIPQVVCSLW